MNLRKPMLATSTAPNPVVSRATSSAKSKMSAPSRSGGKSSPNPFARDPQRPPRNAKSRAGKGAPLALERRYHQTIRRIDLWSVLKVSVCFYLCALIVVLGAGIVLWFVADTFNVIHKVESFVGDLFDDKGFKFFPSEILRAATLLGLVFAALASVMTVLATGFYNLFSDLIGGIEITVAEEA